LGSVGMAVAIRPWLWATAVRQVLVMARPGWWRQWPPVPLPDSRYLELRLQTAYGDAAAPLAADDVVGYLGWCRAWPKVTGRRH